MLRTLRLVAISVMIIGAAATHPRGDFSQAVPAPARGSTTNSETDAGVCEPPAYPLVGITLTQVTNPTGIRDAVSLLSRTRRPTARIVLDPDEDIDSKLPYASPEAYEAKALDTIKDYKTAIDNISGLSCIMGELADSHDLHPFQRAGALAQRAVVYQRYMGPAVQIWEVGNEVNGEWAGWKQGDKESDEHFERRLKDKSDEQLEAQRDNVARQTIGALDKIHDNGGQTALTLYYNDDGHEHHCWPDWTKKVHGQIVKRGQPYEMFRWVDKYMPDVGERAKIDYVLLSYYPDDCPGLDHDAATFVTIFEKLAGRFRNAKFGFGEIGPQCNECKSARDCDTCKASKLQFVQDYYASLHRQIRDEIRGRIDADKSERYVPPVYVGGYFYWYFAQDMTDGSRPEPLNALISSVGGWEVDQPNSGVRR